jgi:hypothetical protein
VRNKLTNSRTEKLVYIRKNLCSSFGNKARSDEQYEKLLYLAEEQCNENDVDCDGDEDNEEYQEYIDDENEDDMDKIIYVELENEV